MRITQSETYRNFVSDLETLNSEFNRISRQVSSGKKLTQLSESPQGSAALLSLTDLASDIDQYKSSADTISYFLGVADSALNEVYNLITSVYSKGSQAASDAVSDEARTAIATDIRSLRDQILSLANSQAKGRYIFAGSMVTAVPFEINGESVLYRGNGEIVSVGIDEGTEIQTGVAGSEAFNPAFAAVESLLAAIDSNDIAAIGDALRQFASVFSGLGQVRGKVGANLSLLESVQSRLDLRETNMKQQRSRLEDVNMAEAVVQMTQVKTALQTSISAGGSILQQSNLFDILG